MFEFLSDTTNQFVIIATLTILSVIGPIIVYLRQRARKSLQFRVISRTSLFSVREEAKGEIEITYRRTKVENADLVLIEVSNSGDVPIKAEDYESPITFDFGENAQILTAEVMKREPENLQMQAGIDGKTVSLTRTLMNSGDSITLKIIATTISKEIKASCHIAGVKKLEEAKPRTSISSMLVVALMALSYASLFGFISLASSNFLLAFILLIMMSGSMATSLAISIWELTKKIRKRLQRRSCAES